MFVSVGQGGNQLAACLWQRAEQQERHFEIEERKRQTRRTAPYTGASSSSSSSATAAASAAAASSSGAAASSCPSSSVPSMPRSPWFALDGYAHAIMLDAEPKVVAQVQKLGLQLHQQQQQGESKQRTGAGAKAARPTPAPASSAPQSLFRPSNLKAEQYGRGNNWAMGYFGRQGDEGVSGSLLETTMDCIRLEGERLDRFSEVVLLHSLAGGTGSGLGSRIAEEVRENFPKHFVMAVSIGPFGAGDTPLQHYNSLLSLAHTYPAVDAVVLASNADVSRALGALALQSKATGGGSSAALHPGSSGGQGSPVMSFAGINTYLSACLADVLGPTKTVPSFRQLELEERARMHPASSASPVNVTPSASASSSSSLLATPSLYELISHAAPLPSFKLLELWSSAGLGASVGAAHMDRNSVSAALPSWKGCMDALQRFVPRDSDDSLLDGGVGSAAARSIGYSVYARGDSVLSDPVSACFDTLSARMAKLFPAVSWNPYPLDLVSTPLPRMAGGGGAAESTRSISVCVNRSRTSLTLRPVVRKARVLLQNKAYVHWYTRYGVEVDEMHDAIDSIESMIDEYQQI